MALVVATISLLVFVVSKVPVESTRSYTFVFLFSLHGVNLGYTVTLSIFPDSSLAVTLTLSTSLSANEILTELGFSCRRTSRFARHIAMVDAAACFSRLVVSQLLSSLAIFGVLLHFDVRLSVSGEHLTRLSRVFILLLLHLLLITLLLALHTIFTDLRVSRAELRLDAL
jgi:hypothetical protein